MSDLLKDLEGKTEDDYPEIFDRHTHAIWDLVRLGALDCEYPDMMSFLHLKLPSWDTFRTRMVTAAAKELELQS